ncbi:tripartite tricarboxylate transporter substrate binding protein [Polynucleobacter sp. MWH-Berg-3C6]|uniref:Bug family tripartite tricarboxylate transporter substrate binding protein n=1 Tax=Polynucleobacter sp. MWH-Berg-3C6 TaxID=1855882 RepID=UPI001C0B06F7|nr:tripartite tricarboxylate transporter substrate binding protein [Polynucleobacter sp. MWH-Berg-3C6]MBU3551413.1 tripartite tricarboxylate transporter substrate binding protein [Polynucleobacter sp. MWH-Berg-3C6]
MKLHRYFSFAIALLTASFSLAAFAQSNYPNRPIRLIIPFTPGGVTDTSGRFIAEQLSLKLGQQVIADNKPGASGNIGSQMVASAEPDGYTLLLGYAGTLSINPSLFDKVPFDSVKDFAPIGKIGDAILIIVANNDFQGKTLADVIAISKKDPNGLSYGTSGSGGTPHIAGELFKQKSGANLVHIPYKGGGQALLDLLGGNIPLVYTAVAGANQYVATGRIKAIAVSSAKRSPSMPDVPTFIESGVKDFVIDDWVGLLAPAKTPKPIIAKLNQALNEILNSPEGKAKLLAMGIFPAPGTPDKFGEQIKGDLVRFAPIVKAALIKSE